MVTIDVSTTLAEAVEAFPQLAREFERRGLDYCCGGQRTLGDACALIGLDPAATIAELSQLATAPVATEWSTMSADVLVDHIEETHHRYLWKELPEGVFAPRQDRVGARCATSGIGGDLVVLHGGARRSGTAPGEGGARPVPDDP